MTPEERKSRLEELANSTPWREPHLILPEGSRIRKAHEMANEPVPLGELRLLAERSRARMDRMVQRARKTDERGDKTEKRTSDILDKHDHVHDLIDTQMDAVDSFNDEMEAQLLGNGPLPELPPEPKGSGSSGDGSSNP